MWTVVLVALFTLNTCGLAEAANSDKPSDELFCSGCQATLKELDKILSKPSKKKIERRINSALEDICNAANFKVYDFIPPKMVKACDYLLANFDAEVKRLLNEHYSSEPTPPFPFLEKNVCRLATRACLQIEEKKKEEDKAKQKIKLKGEEKEFESEYGVFSHIPDDAIIASPVTEKELEENLDPVIETFDQKIEVVDETIMDANDDHVHTEL